MMKREIELALLQVVGDKKATEQTVAIYYAAAIRSSEEVDFPKVNAAIKGRWGKRAVERVKERAWETVEAQKAKEGGDA